MQKIYGWTLWQYDRALLDAIASRTSLVCGLGGPVVLAFVVNLIMPYLAPAIVTIKMGVGPMMNEPKSEAFDEMGDAAAIGGSDKSDGAR